MPCSLTVIILTKNEEAHIQRCINSFSKVPSRIVIVDSFSTDKTIELAKALGADVYERTFYNHANQFNWAIENTNIETEWVMRMDADEFWEEGLAEEIRDTLNTLKSEINGIYIKRKWFFLGKWLKHGGVYPEILLRVWRRGTAKIEQRFMDEHIILNSGSTITLKKHIVDYNLNSLKWWTEKHNSYSSREMVDLLNARYKFFKEDNSLGKTFNNKAAIKRFLKNNVYNFLPLGTRAVAYLIYRYIFRLGFLDGKNGFIHASLQAFWYRFLVDAKIYEFEQAVKKGRLPKEILKTNHDIEI